MECKHCGEKDKSRLMMRSQVVDAKVETINICLDCWWFKDIHSEGENGILQEGNTIERVGEV